MSAMHRMRNPNPNLKCKRNLHDKAFVVYILVLVVLAGGANPNTADTVNYLIYVILSKTSNIASSSDSIGFDLSSY